MNSLEVTKRGCRWGRLLLAATWVLACGAATEASTPLPEQETSALVARDVAFRLVDANPSVSAGLGVKSLTRLGDKVFFRGTAHDGSGTELWVTDGTAEGTHPLMDLHPGLPSADPRNLKVEGDRLTFTAWAEDTSWLWETDGTPAGTHRVRKAFSEAEPNPTSAEVPFVGGLLQLKPVREGAWLWRTDGTSAGTVALGEVWDEERAPFLGDWLSFELVPLGDQILLPGYQPDTGHQLWRTDGTPEGTRPLTRVQGPLGSWPNGVGSFNGGVLFTARTPTSACALWRTEGTVESTRVVREDVCPAPVDSWPPQGAGLGTRFVFYNNDSEHGQEPWVTDGTPEGTHLLLDSAPGNISGGSHGVVLRLGQALLFQAHSALWRTDGTPAGTVRLASFATEHENMMPLPVQFAVLGDRLLFPGSALGTGVELWASDGTPGGTGMIADVVPGQDALFPRGLTVAGGRAYYLKGRELWSTDGTPAGTVRIELEADPTGANSSLTPMARPVIAIGEAAYFLVEGNKTQAMLFKALPGAKARRMGSVEQVDSLVAVNGSLLFSVLEGDHWALWRTRGTSASTTRLGESQPEAWFAPQVTRSSFSNTGFFQTGGLAFFPASAGTEGARLWRTDGTPEGTVPLGSVAPHLFFGGEPPGYQRYPRPAVLDAHGQYLFAGADAAGGLELWATNGNPGAGTYRVQDFHPGPRGSTPEVLLTTPTGVLLAAHDAEAGTEPWWMPLPPPPEDVTPPVVGCPADFRVESPDGNPVEVAFPDVHASDDLMPGPRVTYSLWPGAALAVGTHRVDVQATDVAGNTASCSFQVTIEAVEGELPSVEVPNPEDKKSGCAAGPGGVSAVLMLAWLGLARRRSRSRSGDTAQDA
ncbi:HYR domain-containing protein [Pyxidicoccus trucidator]|uniref:HYR domain-containing protein n=1 Tax=Pyxidicoccus trucidator TaxID=2709662 RepID=UPI0013DC3467|nr:HYR domain-containing protein [Pyxidicoccus trucidator]